MIKPKDIFSLAVIPLFLTLILLVLSIHQISIWMNVMALIERFQALIAGLMAIFAAVITIEQMRRGDEAQGDRHQQMLNASTFYPSKDIKFVAEQLSGELIKSSRSIKQLQENLLKAPDNWRSINTIYYFEMARGIDNFNANFIELATSKFRTLINSEIMTRGNFVLYFGMKLVKVIPSEAYNKPDDMFSQHDRPDWLTSDYISGMSQVLLSIDGFLALVQEWETSTLDEIQSLNYIFKPN